MQIIMYQVIFHDKLFSKEKWTFVRMHAQICFVKSVGNILKENVHQHFNLSLEYFMFLYYLNFQDCKCILHM